MESQLDMYPTAIRGALSFAHDVGRPVVLALGDDEPRERLNAPLAMRIVYEFGSGLLIVAVDEP